MQVKTIFSKRFTMIRYVEDGCVRRRFGFLQNLQYLGIYPVSVNNRVVIGVNQLFLRAVLDVAAPTVGCKYLLFFWVTSEVGGAMGTYFV